MSHRVASHPDSDSVDGCRRTGSLPCPQVSGLRSHPTARRQAESRLVVRPVGAPAGMTQLMWPDVAGTADQFQLSILTSRGAGAPFPVSTSDFRLIMNTAHFVLQ